MSTTSAGEFSWLQKLMSAATYVIAFLIGGLLRDVTDVMDSDRAGALGMRSLAAILALATILEGALSFTGNLTAMAVLSYKSTSLISFALLPPPCSFRQPDAVPQAIRGLRVSSSPYRPPRSVSM